VQLWFGARCSLRDNPAERIWAALKTFLANTAHLARTAPAGC
jgi:hypothetical protein